MESREFDLKSWRDLLGITQQEAARELGLSRATYKAFERGRSFGKGGKPIELPRTVVLACRWIEKECHDEQQ